MAPPDPIRSKRDNPDAGQTPRNRLAPRCQDGDPQLIRTQERQPRPGSSRQDQAAATTAPATKQGDMS